VAVADGDLTPLFALHPSVEIHPPTEFIDDPRRYTHTIKQMSDVFASR
jgi:hypothetical protein